MLLFSYGCRKDIKAIEDFYTYVDIHDYARDSFGLSNIDTVRVGSGFYSSGIYIYFKEGKIGEGAIPTGFEKIYVYYEGTLLTGKEFSNHEMYKKDEDGNYILEDGKLVFEMPFSFYVNSGSVIRGWDSAFAKIPRGSEAAILIPSELAYGDVTQSRIPPNSPLRFDIELLWLIGDPEPETIENTILKSGPNIEISKMMGKIP